MLVITVALCWMVLLVASLPWKFVFPSGIIKLSPQGEGIQAISTSGSFGPCFFRNEDLPFSSGG